MLATVVSYCSNEKRFVEPLLKNALEFSDYVVLCVGRRLYTGAEENAEHIAMLQRVYPEIAVAWYDVSDEDMSTPWVLHNRARQVGVAAARDAYGNDRFWVLLLDGDEVPDGKRVREWFVHGFVTPGHAQDPARVYKMANFWYFLDPRLVADRHEDSVLLVHASRLGQSPEVLAHPRERDGIVMVCERNGTASLVRPVLGLDAQPMFHHFSWVRGGRADLVAKVSNWGHRGERDWKSLVEDAYDQLDRGTPPTRDFVHGYNLRWLTDAPLGVV
jgi:hypothetical protein